MVVNDYMDLVQACRLYLLTVQANEENNEELAEISKLLKSDVTTHNAERLEVLVNKLRSEDAS